jgi:NAD(P)-dependent dehydrogenase (short-subunit alcohol dehydrogenase family)
MTELAGLRAVVTGGTQGIGGATARQLEAAGADVIVAARTEPPPGGAGHFVQADVSTAEGVEALARTTLERLGGIDIIVSNAGRPVTLGASFSDYSDEAWVGDLELNLLSAVRLDRALIPHMLEQGSGAIVHVTAQAWRLPQSRWLAYSAAKAALTAYSKALATELAPQGVRVNAVCPGLIYSDGVDRGLTAYAEAIGRDTAGVVADMVADFNIPIPRAGTPDEAAAVIRFLVSPAASYLTGSVFPIDGGHFPGV